LAKFIVIATSDSGAGKDHSETSIAGHTTSYHESIAGFEDVEKTFYTWEGKGTYKDGCINAR
jgi:hypothetical protein